MASPCTSTPMTANTSTSVDDAAATVDHFSRCLDDVEAWLSSSRLRLNPDKTQVLWLGSKFQLLKVDIQDVPVLTTSVKIVDTARDLGVVINSGLTMSDHVTAVCRSVTINFVNYVRLHVLCLMMPLRR